MTVLTLRKSAIGTKISFLIVVISIIVIVLSVICKCDIILNIGYGVLGSGIVSFVVMLSEYFTSKHEALERYYLVGIETTNHFLECQYEVLTRLDFALAELKWNYDIHKISSKAVQNDFLTKNNDLIEEICNLLKIPSNKLRDDNMIAHFLDMFEKRDIKLRQVMNQYVSLGDYKKLEFENAFGNIYYVLDLKKKQKDIYGNIHNPIQEKHNDLRKCCTHIKRYLSNDITNSPVIYCYFADAIKLLYNVQTSENGIIVYPVFANKISNALEKLRCNIYHEDYHKIDPTPVYANGSFIGDFLDATSVQQKEE